MTYNRLPNDLPSILRNQGLNVVEVGGWRERGRPASTGEFAPVGVLCHHTATRPSSNNDSVINLLVRGRSDLPGPLCQFGLGRDGTVYIIASGRANHAGQAKSVGSVAAGDGNKLYIGIEAFNDGVGEKYSDAQYKAYVLLVATLCKYVTGNSHRTVAGHKETSVTGKIDPTFNMSTFRAQVENKIPNLRRPRGEVVTPSRGGRVDSAIAELKKAKGSGKRAEHIAAALKNLFKIRAR